MDYFLLNTAGDLNDESLCLITDEPEGMGGGGYRMGRGRVAKDHYPTNAKIYLNDENPGIKLSGMIGNTCGFFIVNSDARKIIEKLCADSEIEYLPFSLYNHKKRVHSNDYCFVNPIGGLDCLNEKASGITYDEDDEVEDIEEFVLDSGKVKNFPHLFRIDKERSEYVISGQLLTGLTENAITNVDGELLQVV